jgi:hypothetical protein
MQQRAKKYRPTGIKVRIFGGKMFLLRCCVQKFPPRNGYMSRKVFLCRGSAKMIVLGLKWRDNYFVTLQRPKKFRPRYGLFGRKIVYYAAGRKYSSLGN